MKQGELGADILDENAAVFVLPPLLDISVAAQLRSQLLIFLKEEASDYLIDASAVERITTPCVQVLLAAKQSLATSKHQLLSLTNASQAMSAALHDLGLEHALIEK